MADDHKCPDCGAVLDYDEKGNPFCPLCGYPSR